jgi:hypothetical protein
MSTYKVLNSFTGMLTPNLSFFGAAMCLGLAGKTLEVPGKNDKTDKLRQPVWENLVFSGGGVKVLAFPAALAVIADRMGEDGRYLFMHSFVCVCVCVCMDFMCLYVRVQRQFVCLFVCMYVCAYFCLCMDFMCIYVRGECFPHESGGNTCFSRDMAAILAFPANLAVVTDSLSEDGCYGVLICVCVRMCLIRNLARKYSLFPRLGR